MECIGKWPLERVLHIIMGLDIGVIASSEEKCKALFQDRLFHEHVLGGFLTNLSLY